MPHFGKHSKARLATCDKQLVAVANEVIKYFDHRVLHGHRGEYAQDEAFRLGNSTKPWPESKHNQEPSPALDVAPYYPHTPHIRWNNAKDFVALASYYLAIGETLGVKLRWGGDWDGDNNTYDQKFHDLGHIEIIKEEDTREEINQLIAAATENQRSF